MNKFFGNRINTIMIVVFLVGLVLIGKLADLQLVNGDVYRQKSETLRTRKIVVEAPRGNIVDKYGRVLAGNKQTYTVNVMKIDTDPKTLNEMSLKLVEMIEKNGDVIKDDVPIEVNPFRFKFKDDEMEWKKKHSLPKNATAEQAFAKLREDFNISGNMLDLEAYDVLKNDMNIDIPFDLYNLQFDFLTAEKKWKKHNSFDINTTAEQAFYKLAEKLKIPKAKYTIEQMKKIMAIRYVLSQNTYKAFEPVEIATNVNEKSRAEIEENRVFLPGVEVVMKPVRGYPLNELASHILGYMTRIGDEIDTLKDKGYQPDAMIGKSGIENSMEKYLKGTNGEKQVEVDVKGNLIDTIGDKAPIPGDTVFLTLDSELQKVATEALNKSMEQIRKGNPKLGIMPFPNAKTGSAVAIEINTGKVLAMVSLPQYDPNMFSTGITTQNWKSLQPQGKSIYTPKPLVNIAISSPQAPGSTMKMATAIAGLQSGAINPSTIVNDVGFYTAIPGVRPSCLIWKTSRRVHGPQDVTGAIKYSCNYFFFETGRRMGGATFEKYAKKLGFGSYTGIELPNEYKGRIEGPENKKAFYKAYLKSYLKNGLKMTNEKDIAEVIGWLDKNKGGREIRKRLNELGFASSNTADKILQFVSESNWMPGNVLNAAIGQGMDSATSLQMASYVATIVNGGNRYKPYIVEKIIGYDGSLKLSSTPKITEKLNLKKEYVDAIKKGMYGATNEQGGTATRLMGVSKIVIGGKTGTAEAGKFRPDSVKKPNYYVNYDAHGWFVAFAPYDNPKIAICINVLQGGHGGYSAEAGKQIIEAYLIPKKINDINNINGELIK